MILFLGSYGAGITLRVPRVPDRGETISGAVLSVGHGGKSSNQAVAARRQGADVELLTAIGDDSFGQDARLLWEAEGVGHANVQVVPEVATMVGAILVEPSGDNRIAIAPGALDTVTADWVESKAGLFDQASILVACLECPTSAVEAAIRLAKSRDLRVILNPAPAAALSPQTLSLADYLVPNETEYQFYADGGFERAAGQVLIVTRGESGVFVSTDDGDKTYSPLRQSYVVDTTGAGDTFVGVFAAGLDEGLGLDEAIDRAIVASSISVTQHEVIPSLPDRGVVDTALRDRKAGGTQ